MQMTSPRPVAARQNYRRLQILRSLVAMFLCLMLVIFYQWLRLELNYLVLGTLLMLSVSLNIASWIRTKKPAPITDREFFINLLLDVVLISALLYFCGGASNPFVSYFLVPLTISAATLPWSYTWWIAGISLLAYSALVFFYQPLPAMAPNHGGHGFSLHIFGMWVNFTISVALISFFVVKMSTALRRQDEMLALEREERLRDEQILGVATVAAGTAHELGTPLSTIKTLVGELRQTANDENSQEDFNLIEKQVDLCADTLQRLVKKADQITGKSSQVQAVEDFCQSLLEQWQILRPDVQAAVELTGDPAQTAAFHPSLNQAILNLLNNAADAEPTGVRVTAEWDNRELSIDIYDQGAGVSVDVAEALGTPFNSDKDSGLGLGFFLSNATLNRFGGSVALYQVSEGGTHTAIKVPLMESADV